MKSDLIHFMRSVQSPFGIQPEIQAGGSAKTRLPTPVYTQVLESSVIRQNTAVNPDRGMGAPFVERSSEERAAATR